jgi:hypothetical protein
MSKSGTYLHKPIVYCEILIILMPKYLNGEKGKCCKMRELQEECSNFIHFNFNNNNNIIIIISIISIIIIIFLLAYIL